MDISSLIPLSPQQKDLLIIILGTALLICISLIVFLIKRLKKEKWRSQVPVLTFNPHLDPQDTGLYLQNMSDIPAKDIVLQDLDVIIESNISGTMTLKFEPVNILPGHEQEQLRFKIFSGSFPIANVTPANITPHFFGTTIEARITYSNLNNVRFTSILQKNKNSSQFSIKKVEPVN